MTFDVTGFRADESEESFFGEYPGIFGITAFCRNPKCCLPVAVIAIAKIDVESAKEKLSSADGVTHFFQIRDVWPEPPKPSCPEYVPAEVERAFLEAEDCRLRKNWGSAAMSYRRALERAVNAIHPEGGTNSLAKTLKELEREQRITPDIASWADEIRIIGNGVAHDAKDPGEAEVEDQANFTRMALVYLFEMPERVRLLRGKKTE